MTEYDTLLANFQATSLALVTTPISQQPTLETYRNALKVIRPNPYKSDLTPPDRTEKPLQGFSDKSRSRLRFIAENCTIPLISQFGLTYHREWPTDGRIAKAHLNHWLIYAKRIIPGVQYLWLMEFQSRQAPHFHIFFTTPPDRVHQIQLAEIWNRIIGAGEEHYTFHNHEKNWIKWDMTTANYLTKYLDKESQKTIPENYVNFGRFWGNSRDLKPTATQVYTIENLDDICTVDENTGEYYGGAVVILRWLGRLAEKQTYGYSKFRTRAQTYSYSMRRGSPALKQIIDYFDKLNEMPF